MSFHPLKREKEVPTTQEIIPPNSRRKDRVNRMLIAALPIAASALTLGYAGISFLVAMQVVRKQPKAVTRTPADLGLSYRDVSFHSRENNLLLRGWFIPGVLPGRQLTTERAIIMVHGLHSNREALEAGLLDLSAALARQGFAILAFDLRGHGQSAPAPLSMGYFEQQDVLGAVDFLRSGSLPYPELGHPRAIGGWGISLGGASVLLAAAQEPAIQGVVADCAFAAFVPLLEKDPKIPKLFIPGVTAAMRLLHGIDYHAVRPVDVVASIAPRPLFFIQSGDDKIVPPWNLDWLAGAASAAPDARVQTWLIPGVDHIQSYHVMGTAYVNRVVAFFTDALGPATQSPV
jgi:uncharacterized protein